MTDVVTNLLGEPVLVRRWSHRRGGEDAPPTRSGVVRAVASTPGGFSLLVQWAASRALGVVVVGGGGTDEIEIEAPASGKTEGG